MARSRNIKPGFFINYDLGRLEPLARLLFAGLWCIADREGRLEDVSPKIKIQVLPYDECDVDRLLNELTMRGFIIRYEVEDKRYIQIVKWSRHQNPHKNEVASIIPPAPVHIANNSVQVPNKSEALGLIPDSLSSDSLILIQKDISSKTDLEANTPPEAPSIFDPDPEPNPECFESDSFLISFPKKFQKQTLDFGGTDLPDLKNGLRAFCSRMKDGGLCCRSPDVRCTAALLEAFTSTKRKCDAEKKENRRLHAVKYFLAALTGEADKRWCDWKEAAR